MRSLLLVVWIGIMLSSHLKNYLDLRQVGHKAMCIDSLAKVQQNCNKSIELFTQPISYGKYDNFFKKLHTWHSVHFWFEKSGSMLDLSSTLDSEAWLTSCTVESVISTVTFWHLDDINISWRPSNGKPDWNSKPTRHWKFWYQNWSSINKWS